MLLRLAACLATAAAAFTFAGGPAAADGHGNPDHCGHGSHPECPTGYNVIVGGPGVDILFGTFGQDAIFGLGGNDRLRAKAGDDLVFGGTGNDILRGGLGSDTLRGGNGHDLCIGDSRDRFVACERVVVLSLLP